MKKRLLTLLLALALAVSLALPAAAAQTPVEVSSALELAQAMAEPVPARGRFRSRAAAAEPTRVVAFAPALADGYGADRVLHLAAWQEYVLEFSDAAAAQRALVLPPAMAAALPAELAAQYGMTGAELDAIVREYITSRGYGGNYVHGLGHGVGLEIHEMPNINKRGTDVVLEPGMTFSIEPGIYIPGKGGVRIEDTVVLTDDGAKVLCGVKKQLMEIV